MNKMIGKNVSWTPDGRNFHDGVVIAEVAPGADICTVIKATGMETTPMRIHEWTDRIIGARYAKIGSIRSINPRYLVLVNGKYLYAPRKSAIDTPCQTC